ncbi:MAG: hypothetical protein JZU64_11335 [Rhodoferax sp.]|nr:hypothetical protein [Rhodoferax sp.]
MEPITDGNQVENTVENNSINSAESFLDFDANGHINLDIKTNNNNYQLIRLRDDEFFQLERNTLSIHVDYGHLINLSMDEDLIYSSFSRMYAALTHLFGSSGRLYDDWKGSFSFPFLIRFKKNGEEFGYLLNIFNMRSGLEFCFYKLISANDTRFDRIVMQKPFEEFPQDEINYLVNYIAGYCTGYFNETEKYHDDCFLLITESNLLLSGCHDHVYFDHSYESPEEFQAAMAVRKPQCTPPRRSLPAVADT